MRRVVREHVRRHLPSWRRRERQQRGHGVVRGAVVRPRVLDLRARPAGALAPTLTSVKATGVVASFQAWKAQMFVPGGLPARAAARRSAALLAPVLWTQSACSTRSRRRGPSSPSRPRRCPSGGRASRRRGLRPCRAHRSTLRRSPRPSAPSRAGPWAFAARRRRRRLGGRLAAAALRRALERDGPERRAASRPSLVVQIHQ